MAINKHIPSIPDSADGQLRGHLRQLWDRLNFVLDAVEELRTGGGQVASVQSQVSRLNVAIAAVQDNLAKQSTFVGFQGTTTVSGVDTGTSTGFGYVQDGNWNFITGTAATQLLSTFSLNTKGLVPGPSTVDGTKFLSDDGQWKVVSSGGGSSIDAFAFSWFVSR